MIKSKSNGLVSDPQCGCPDPLGGCTDPLGGCTDPCYNIDKVPKDKRKAEVKALVKIESILRDTEIHFDNHARVSALKISGREFVVRS